MQSKELLTGDECDSHHLQKAHGHAHGANSHATYSSVRRWSDKDRALRKRAHSRHTCRTAPSAKRRVSDKGIPSLQIKTNKLTSPKCLINLIIAMFWHQGYTLNSLRRNYSFVAFTKPDLENNSFYGMYSKSNLPGSCNKCAELDSHPNQLFCDLTNLSLWICNMRW